jgi:hypothetical protein
VGYGEEPLSQEGEQSQTIPNLNCLKTSTAEDTFKEILHTEKEDKGNDKNTGSN